MGTGASILRPSVSQTHRMERDLSEKSSSLPLSHFVPEEDSFLHTCEQLAESYETFGEPTIIVMNKLLHRFGEEGARLAKAQNNYLSRTKVLYNQVLLDEEFMDVNTSALFLHEALSLYDLQGKTLSERSRSRIVRGMVSILKKRRRLNWSQLEIVLRAVSWTLMFHPECFV